MQVSRIPSCAAWVDALDLFLTPSQSPERPLRRPSSLPRAVRPSEVSCRRVPRSNTHIGSVFEKRLIEAYVAEHGKDPVNGEELGADELIEVKSQRVVRPRPPTLTSIPSLLSVFQEEWDALALETYTLQQNLAQTRRELSSALYQHDAAVRVIARLTQERDEAREALSKVSVGAGRPAADGEAMQVDSAGLPQVVLERIENTQAQYVQLISFVLILRLTHFTDSPNLAASAPFPKAGLPATPSRRTSPLKPLNRFTPAAGHWLLTLLANWPLLEALMVWLAFTRSLRRAWFRH